MKYSILLAKGEAFSVRVINMEKHLVKEHSERVMSLQVKRCGTSISANIAEALCAHSTADFVSKLQISLKETHETNTWLNLLFKTDYLTEKEYESMHKDCDEIMRLLIHSINKMKKAQ